MDNRCMLWLRKSIENVLILWFIHTFKTVHLKQSKRDAEFYSTFVNRRYTKEVPLLSVNELLYIVLTTCLRIG